MTRSVLHSTEDRYRRRIFTAILVVGVVAIVSWIAVIAALAGGGRGAEQGGRESMSQQPVSSETTAENNDNPSGEPRAESSGEATGEPAPQQPEQAQPDERGQAPTDEGVETLEGTGTGEVFDPLEEEARPTDAAANPPEEASREQTATPGKEPEPGSPSEIDEARARAASEGYITAAYGYTGDSEEEYLEGIEQAASEEIYDSPGGRMLKGYAEAAPECGMRSTAYLEELEVIGESPEGLDVAVTFSVEDADGQTHTFRQDQRLVSSETGYEVSGVSVEELISQTSPKGSCPGAAAKEDPTDDSSPETPEGPENKATTGSLTETDQARARATVESFVTAAYGYTGHSGEEYTKGVSRAVEEETFLPSPGGERVRDYTRAAEESGIESAAFLEEFEVTRVGPDQVQGTAYFRVGESYDRYGELDGEGTAFAQDLTLVPSHSTYEVSRAGLEQEISQWAISHGQAKTS